MKEKIIETAGKIWQFLGHNGETDVSILPKRLKEKNDVVFQALGWLAREDKIGYSVKNKKTLASLIESERQIFNSIMVNMPTQKKEVTRAKRRTAKAV